MRGTERDGVLAMLSDQAQTMAGRFNPIPVVHRLCYSRDLLVKIDQDKGCIEQYALEKWKKYGLLKKKVVCSKGTTREINTSVMCFT